MQPAVPALRDESGPIGAYGVQMRCQQDGLADPLPGLQPDDQVGSTG